MIPTYIQCATAIIECRETPPLKTMIDENDLSLPKWFITYALVLRYLRPVVDRFERIRRRRQALKIAAVMFICLRSVSNGSSPSLAFLSLPLRQGA